MSISSELESVADPRSSRLRRVARRAAQIGVGLGLGLIVAEGAFWLRDGGSFPHVNFYVADAELGARLQPGTKTRFRLGDNPIVPVTVNAQGFSGADWPAPEAMPERAVMVFGDSQVFGLGVGDGETFSARLEALGDRPVLNAGVPTYGPPEYLALARELLAEREVDTVVYVVNFLNDPFELDRPNVERHAIWDGWAVRLETAPGPGDVVEFPGRRWLMSRSHLVYAARRWWHGREAEAWGALSSAGLASEGQWDELLVHSERSRAQEDARVEAVADVARERADAEQRAAEVRDAIAHADTELEAVEGALAEHRGGPKQRYVSPRSGTILRHNPGDIVAMPYSEGSRSIEITASMYESALAERRRVQADNVRAAQRHQRRRAELERERERLRARAESGEAEAELDALERRIAELEARVDAPPARVALSVFEPHLRELKALCDGHGAALVVVALPIDVQVSRDEWRKYGVDDGPDMSATRVLLEDLVLDAEALGIEAFDATAALRAAEPGAFLNGDIHMTPKGHAALAEAVAAAIERAHRA